MHPQPTNTTAEPDDVAIVGLSCRFAGAADTAAFWSNLVTGRCAISDHPNPLASRILDPTSPLFDRLHTQRGGYLRDLNTFVPGAFGLTPDALAGANPDQFLALHLATTALRQAGITPSALPAGRTGLVLGYASPLNVATANWLQHGLIMDQTITLLHRLFPGAAETQLNEIRQSLKESLPPVRPAALRTAFGHALAGQARPPCESPAWFAPWMPVPLPPCKPCASPWTNCCWDAAISCWQAPCRTAPACSHSWE